MSDKDVPAVTGPNVPDSQGRVPGSGYSSVRIGHLKTANGRRVSSESM